MVPHWHYHAECARLLRRDNGQSGRCADPDFHRVPLLAVTPRPGFAGLGGCVPSEIVDPMRVLHVIPAVAPRYGGPSQAVIEMCASLKRVGIDVELCATDADGNGHLNVEIDKPTLYRGVRAHFFRRDWSEAFKFSRSMDRWLDRNIGGYDIVHIHAVFSHATHAAARACRQHHVPYIVRPLGTLEPWSMQQKQLRKALAWHFLFRRELREAAAIHYTTEQERELTERSRSEEHTSELQS